MFCIYGGECTGCGICRSYEEELYQCNKCYQKLIAEDAVYCIDGEVMGCIYCVEVNKAKDLSYLIVHDAQENTQDAEF